jgi:hypothetical protein
MDNKRNMNYEQAKAAAKALEQELESKKWHVVVKEEKDKRVITVQGRSYLSYGGNLQQSFPYIWEVV